jgi:hypothetical protein
VKNMAKRLKLLSLIYLNPNNNLNPLRPSLIYSNKCLIK